jgi:hypothetical protein
VARIVRLDALISVAGRSPVVESNGMAHRAFADALTL